MFDYKRHITTNILEIDMKVKRQLITTIETERTVSLKITKAEICLFCRVCGYETEMLSINEAVILIKKNWREVINQANIGDLHFMETTNGEIYFCLVSLSKLSSGRK